jgi:nucleoside-diphosphate-sugar epimerase
MRVLVTGASGRVAAPILRGLHQEGYTLRAMSRGALPDEARALADEIVQGDVLEQRDWRRALREIDAVIHLAGIAENTWQVFDHNTAAARVMTRACAEAEVNRLLFASDLAALGHAHRPQHRPFDFDFFPLDEAHPLKCETDYGLSKAVCEQIIAAAARRWALHATALRLAPVWSQAQCERRRAHGLDEDTMAHSLWAWLHEEDCARAFSLALRQPLQPGHFEALFICAADTLADTPSAALVARHFPALANRSVLRDHQSFVSSRRALDSIGFVPAWSWRPDTLLLDPPDAPFAF